MVKGHYTEVRFDATINKGNYENEKLGVTYSMAEGEDVFEVIKEVKGIVLGGETSRPATKTEASIGSKKATKEKTEVVQPGGHKETLKEEPAKEEKLPLEEAVEEAAKVEAPVEEKKKAKETKPKADKSAPVVIYDRKNDNHKARLADFLDAWNKNWKAKDSDTLKKASAASSALHGTEAFLDADGKLLESFKEKFLGYMK